MKHSILISFYLLVLLGTGKMSAQSIIDLGIFNQPANSNKLEIRTRSTQNVSPGYLSGLVFTVRHPATYGVSLSVDFGPPYFLQASGTGTSDGYVYYSFSFGGNPFLVNWTAGVSYLAGVLSIVNEGGSGMGTFELVTHDPWTIANNGNYYVELNGTNMRNVFFQPNTAAPLPVELQSFKAKALPNGSAQLDWESTSEVDLAHYVIEHSSDGYRFSDLGKESARGGQNVTTAYEYNHISPQPGVNYYRLRMVGIRGDHEFSPIQTVTFDKEDADFTVLPNPSIGPLILTSRHLDKYADGLKFQLTDNSGKLIRMDNITDEKTNFDLSNEPAGAYFLNILSESQQITQFRIVLAKQ